MTLSIFVEPVELASAKGYVKRYTIRSKFNGITKNVGRPFTSRAKAIAVAKEVAIKYEKEHPYTPNSQNKVELFIEGGSKDGAYMTINGKFVEFKDVP